MCWRLLPACVCHPVMRCRMQVSEMEQMVESVMQGITEMEGRLQRSEEALGESQAACTKAETRLAEAMKRVRVCVLRSLCSGDACADVDVPSHPRSSAPFCTFPHLSAPHCTSLYLSAPLCTSSVPPLYPLVPELTAECRPRADP
jgi:hypothetical protein